MIHSAWALAALLTAGRPAAAQVAPDDASDWTLEAPPSTGTATPTPTPEGSFSTPDRILFGEAMRQRALDQICRGVDLTVDQGLALGDIGHASGRLGRRLRMLPDDRIALVDEQTVRLELSKGFPIKQLGDVGTSITLSARLDGSSFVSRPMATRKACKEVINLVKINHFKSVLPISASRISKMQVGELWKLPMVLHIGHSEGAGAPLGPYGSASVSFGVGQEGSAIITLYRMSEEAVRFRFRADHARLHNQSGSIVASYPAPHFVALQGANIILKQIDSLATREIAHYLNAGFSLWRASTDGQQVLMEFVFDPRDHAEMELLASAMRGDLKALVIMAERMATLQATADRARADFAAMEREHERKFGRASNYPALNVYRSVSRGISLRLPFLLDLGHSRSYGSDRVVKLTDEGGQFQLFRKDSGSNSGFFDIPREGNIVKHNVSRSVQSFVYEDKEGRATQPQVVYISQEGFLRRDAADVRRMADDINRLMTRAGTKGGAPNPRLAIPIDALLPPPPPPPPEPEDSEDSEPAGPTGPIYHDGSISLTLVLTQKAVADILSATAETVAYCYSAVLDTVDKALVRFALATSGFDAEGRLRYDRRAFRRAFDEVDGTRARMERLCKVVTRIVKDLAWIRSQPTEAERAQALAKVMGGEGRSKLAYSELLEVLIQLVDPLDLTADVALNVRKKRKSSEADAHAHFMLRRNRPENVLLRQAGEAKGRFAKPSDLVD